MDRKPEVTECLPGLYALYDGMVRQFLAVGEDSALLVDTGFEDSHVLDVVRTITDLPLTVVLTHGDRDHTGGVADFAAVSIHEADAKMLPEGKNITYLKEGDVLTAGKWCFEVIEIPGHTYGSIALLDRKTGVLLPGDSVQKDGPIFMFGPERNLNLFIASLQKLEALGDVVKTVLPCHHDSPIGREYIGFCLADAIALRDGKLTGEPHDRMPCKLMQGQYVSYLYND